MKKIKVDFCATNLQYRSRPLFEKLKERADLDVREWGCLGNCELCETGPYLILGDRFLLAATVAELEQMVEEALAELGARDGARP